MGYITAEEYQLAYDSAYDFAQKKIRPLNAEIEQADEFPRELWRLLAEQGYLGVGIPEEHGGSGGDCYMAGLVLRGLTRVNPAVAMSVGAHLNLCAHNILRNGTEQQKEIYLPRLAQGEMVGGLALTEPNAGSDAMGMQMTATRTAGGYLLNGTKVFITNGPIADVLVIYAKTLPEAKNRGITAFIFETQTPGYAVARKIAKVGMRGSPTGELVLKDAFVPDANVLGSVNEGYKVVMSGLDLERAIFACSGVGLLETALALSLKYAQEREQFGQPIAHFQLIQAKLADIYTNLEAARLLVERCFQLTEQGKRISKEAAAAILYVGRACTHATYEAMQIFGGAGYTTEFEVERLWRDARVVEIGAGTTEIRQLIIARELLGLRGHEG